MIANELMSGLWSWPNLFTFVLTNDHGNGYNNYWFPFLLRKVIMVYMLRTTIMFPEGTNHKLIIQVCFAAVHLSSKGVPPVQSLVQLVQLRLAISGGHPMTRGC